MKQKIIVIICSLFGLSGIIVYNVLFHKRNNNLDTNELKIGEIIDTITKYDFIISDTKYQEIYETIGSYLHHCGMSEKEQREFLYDLCDTTNRIFYPVFFKYSSQINGYNVEGSFCIATDASTEHMSYGRVYANLYFSSDSLTFSVMHPTFHPFKDGLPHTINALDCIELEYNNPVFPNPHKIPLDSIHDLPFAFVDINFDGIKDLLLANPGNGQKTISTYTAYSLPKIEEINPFQGYTWNCLDEWTEFDYTTKTVISSLWGGYDGSEKWYFRYEGNRLKPYIKEEYTHWFDSIKSSTHIP